MSDRSLQLNQWLEELGYRDYRLAPASEDASFRSYLRLETEDGSFVIMDAPPDKEPCDSFILVAGKLRDAGLSAPEVIESDLGRGFLLLTDFGVRDYLAESFAKWWLPDAVEFLDEIPRTSTGKFQKTALRERFKDYELG